ncbi:hypothetical protein BpHYR1_047306 [Brachionus plicatilis]|uniref:Uncharacterized protein n=1 Tax=Brachionus plicatilis TaxID=10195 RepID=A0A3M7T0K7_BRAPC|nr:hypothetical protein BpHYR1_047306 [Brachionus plicatilis]
MNLRIWTKIYYFFRKEILQIEKINFFQSNYLTCCGVHHRYLTVYLFIMYVSVNYFTLGDEDKSPRRLIKVLLGASNVYSACKGYLTSVS